MKDIKLYIRSHEAKEVAQEDDSVVQGLLEDLYIREDTAEGAAESPIKFDDWCMGEYIFGGFGGFFFQSVS